MYQCTMLSSKIYIEYSESLIMMHYMVKACIVDQLKGRMKVKLCSEETPLLYFHPTNKRDVNLFWDQ